MNEPDYTAMQQGELDWWRAWLAQPHGQARILALYGYRYLDFFFAEFGNLGRVIDFGSGPVSAAYIGDPPPDLVWCVDPLFHQYREAGLLYDKTMIEVDQCLSHPRPFDTALLLNVLDHCDDPAGLVAAAGLALRPGGKALLWVHAEVPPDALHRRVLVTDVPAWLHQAGLVIERTKLRMHMGPPQFMALGRKP
jgi:SAM-dependent methyltransferase